MNRQEIENKVKKILIEQLDIEADRIKPESAITHGLGADTDLCVDSLGIVELLMALEEAFEMDIPDEEVMNLKTVKNIVDYVHGIKAAGLKPQTDPNGNPIKPCCDNERRNINGGCDNCGAPCL